MNEITNTEGTFQMVPAGFAEKAMASLMQLHSELMGEKEKRVDLFRQLMEREQALAELKLYVKQLEAKTLVTPVPVTADVSRPQAGATGEVASMPKSAVPAEPVVSRVTVTTEMKPTPAASASARVSLKRPEGWRVW